MSQLTNILTKLRDISDTNLVDIFVASQERIIKFRQLSIKQQKDLFKTGLDGVAAGLTLSEEITNIINTNSMENVEFSIYDKIPIILKLRANALGTNCVVLNDNNQQTLDFNQLLARDIKIPLPEECTKHIVFESEIELDISYPSLAKDSKINRSHIDKAKKQEGISEAIGNLYIYEIAKYIDTITIGPETIDCNLLAVKELVSIIENLPAKLNEEVISFMGKLRKSEEEFLTISNNVIIIDSRFFTKE